VHILAVLEGQRPVSIELYFVGRSPSGSFSTGSAFIGSMKEGAFWTFAFTICQYPCDERVR
jgi:hypothetical protein